ncbi:MAG: hypothetical protein QOH27_6363 [Mycobacterium sp.]|jgi:hypothetical protein|nr:hypothetical protein [Mycobacterium sp.]
MPRSEPALTWPTHPQHSRVLCNIRKEDQEAAA